MFSLNLHHKGLAVYPSPIVMGILNLTSDSFFADSRISSLPDFLCRAEEQLRAGATWLDLGACSTRPNSTPVTEEAELARLMEALEAMATNEIEPVLSVDTFRPHVAEVVCRDYHVDVINDISGGCDEMYAVAAQYGAAYILTHNGGFESIADVVDYLQVRVNRLHQFGVHDIILDPGLGFGKDIEHNYLLLRNLPWLKQMLDLPVLVGLSRKRMIYELLGTTPQDALYGTIAADTLALVSGADILRVHDVKAAADSVKVFNQWNI